MNENRRSLPPLTLLICSAVPTLPPSNHWSASACYRWSPITVYGWTTYSHSYHLSIDIPKIHWIQLLVFVIAYPWLFVGYVGYFHTSIDYFHTIVGYFHNIVGCFHCLVGYFHKSLVILQFFLVTSIIVGEQPIDSPGHGKSLHLNRWFPCQVSLYDDRPFPGSW